MYVLFVCDKVHRETLLGCKQTDTFHGRNTLLAFWPGSVLCFSRDVDLALSLQVLIEELTEGLMVLANVCSHVAPQLQHDQETHIERTQS